MKADSVTSWGRMPSPNTMRDFRILEVRSSAVHEGDRVHAYRHGEQERIVPAFSEIVSLPS